MATRVSPSAPAAAAHDLTVGQLAEATGETVHTLRYWDSMGLLPGVRRNRAGHRLFSVRHVGWVGLLERLRVSGMSIARMRRYAKLAAAGDAKKSERLELLREHADDIRSSMAELERCLEIVEAKIELYEGRRTDVESIGAMVASAKRASSPLRVGVRARRPAQRQAADTDRAAERERSRRAPAWNA